MTPKKRATRSTHTGTPGAKARVPAPASHNDPRAGWPFAFVAAALLVATLAAYYPAWRGGMVWDDDRHVTSAELRPVEGLRRIWFELGATQQYYPVVHSVFWLEHRLWGDDTLGYHLVNIVLHALSSILVLVVLTRLRVPGAVLAAVLFALHPVHVESVAWITELKNTLSGVFFLFAALAYLRFDGDRSRRAYGTAAALFCLALLSKSVTAMLPVVLLVVFWWKRGRLDWRRDVLPLLPFLAVGAAAGLFTAWVERTYIGAEGAEFHLTLVERGLLAGRVIWFYLGKLVWPSNLIFVYPRWEISQAAAWQYLYPAAVVALLAALWAVRGRSRAPLAALLAFAGLLFPVLGFLNVFPFRFSFVADHFQYLASIPILALISAGAAIAAGRWGPRGGGLTVVLTLTLGVTLGTLTFGESRQYADALTLYRTTLDRNPSCWMAHGNLGALLRRTDPDQALVHLAQAVRLKPDLVEGHYNLATALQQVGRLDEAAGEYRTVIRLEPAHARAHANLGNVLQQQGRLDEAERAYKEAIRLAPRLALAHSGLGRVLQAAGRLDEARRSCETAVTLDPGFAAAHRDLAGVLQEQGHTDEAVREYAIAVRLQPDQAEAHYDLAVALQQAGRFDEAAGYFREAARLEPGAGVPLAGLCATLRMAGRLDEAGRAGEAAVTGEPTLALAHYELANVLHARRLLGEALEHYRAAIEREPGVPEFHYALALALDEAGRAREAREQEDEALRLAPDAVTARMSMANALEALGRLNAARAEFEEVLRLAPEAAAARVALVRIDARRRLIPEAAAVRGDRTSR